MTKRRERSDYGFANINVTPLMDLTFLLLIVFMITAPMMEYAVDVSPPEITAEEFDDQDSIKINLTNEGKIIIEERRLVFADLKKRLEEIFQRRPGSMVFIRGDESRPYGEVIKILRIARQVGFSNASLITAAEE